MFQKLNTKFWIGLLFVSAVTLGCQGEAAQKSKSGSATSRSGEVSLATFAGGCFWCMEKPFDLLDGVISTTSGYSGGKEKSPSYKDVSYGRTGHLEVVQIKFDPNKVTYHDLLAVFWKQINPTDAGGQFVDRGPQYATAIFYHSDEQKKQAEASRALIEKSKIYPKPIVTPIRKFEAFYAAEGYHQNYYKENPLRYKYYRSRSGRDDYLDSIWGSERKKKVPRPDAGASKTKPLAQKFNPSKTFVKPSRDQLKDSLSAIQYYVTQEDGTERPFKNEFWDNKRDGIYVDVVSGEPLFSSTHKYKSGTGWPSFYQPLEKSRIVEKADYKLGVKRVEVRSKDADSHLGHVFDDGPRPTGLRYCINSASLRFVPKEKLEESGYGKYLALFSKAKK